MEPLAVIERYAIYDSIGRGGMATIHLARQLGGAGFSRTVAVKRLHPHVAAQEQFVRMMLDEAHLASRVEHPNVVRVLDVVEGENELFMVQEYAHALPVSTLAANAIRSGDGVPPAIALHVLIGVLRGLHAAHIASGSLGEPLNIVHRDVSPQNVLLGPHGVPQVVDFGVAKASRRLHTTQQGEIKGKLRYMAPEQLLCKPVTAQADVYSAAVMLWELLAGKRLFDADSPTDISYQKLQAEVPAPSSLRPILPPALDAVVLKGLERDPEKRYRTAKQMADALQAFVAKRPSLGVTPEQVGAWAVRWGGEAFAERERLLRAIEGAPAPQLRNPPSSAKIAFERDSSPDESEVLASAQEPKPDAEPSQTMRGTSAPGTLRVPPRVARRMLPRFLAGAAVLLMGLGLVSRLERGGEPAPEVLAAAPSAPEVVAAVEQPSCPAGMLEVRGSKLFLGWGGKDATETERPQRQVDVATFCIDRTEVSVAAYKQCSDRGECSRVFPEPEIEGASKRERILLGKLCNTERSEDVNHPISCVDWSQASGFCKAHGKRLPSSAEWEYAARGSDGRAYPWGDGLGERRANACGAECFAWSRTQGLRLPMAYAADDGHVRTAPVDAFADQAAPSGALNMVGNVAEWVEDWYAPRGDHAAGDEAEGDEAEGDRGEGDRGEGDRGEGDGPRKREVRGGHFLSPAGELRASVRDAKPASERSPTLGFRCAADLKPPGD
ncbi:MAG: SUMF1/EgtB/PvdO family nonheme iron enzyme [Myxococcales bacterium]|nr:SUMF1/EgtB/PvdO family nonheme iron enzyme [Myxococcales bacterium]